MSLFGNLLKNDPTAQLLGISKTKRRRKKKRSSKKMTSSESKIARAVAKSVKASVTRSKKRRR